MVAEWALDDMDLGILEVLASHGRSTLCEVAAAVGCHERTVQSRMAALEAHGVLLGYEATVDWGLVGLPQLTLIEAYCPPDQLAEASRLLQAIPTVVHALVTTGPSNVVILARNRGMREMKQLLLLLSATPLVRIGTRVAVEPLVEERPPSMAALRALPPPKPKAAVRYLPALPPAAPVLDRLALLQRAGLAGLDAEPQPAASK